MTSYKHTQVGYLMIVISLAVLALFAWVYSMALAEVPSVDSGPNLLVSTVMVLILLILVSFITLTVAIDERFVRIRFGYGIFSKKFLLDDIVSAKAVKNHWYFGWGVRFWFWPRMTIYNISGFDAVEITMRNGKIYRIGTDEPKELERALNNQLNK